MRLAKNRTMTLTKISRNTSNEVSPGNGLPAPEDDSPEREKE